MFWNHLVEPSFIIKHWFHSAFYKFCYLRILYWYKRMFSENWREPGGGEGYTCWQALNRDGLSLVWSTTKPCRIQIYQNKGIEKIKGGQQTQVFLFSLKFTQLFLFSLKVAQLFLFSLKVTLLFLFSLKVTQLFLFSLKVTQLFLFCLKVSHLFLLSLKVTAPV